MTIYEALDLATKEMSAYDEAQRMQACVLADKLVKGEDVKSTLNTYISLKGKVEGMNVIIELLKKVDRAPKEKDCIKILADILEDALTNFYAISNEEQTG